MKTNDYKKSLFCMLLLIISFVTATNAQVQGWNMLLPVSGDQDDFIRDMCTDAQRNIITGGTYRSTELNFDTLIVSTDNNGPSSFYLSDVFIAKYNQNGDILWAKTGGGNYGDMLTALSTDVSGNIYFAGYFSSDTFLFDSIPLRNKALSNPDLFVGKLDPAGNLIWLKGYGNAYDAYARDISTDDAGNLYIAGEFYHDSIDFDTIRLRSTGTWNDIFVLKLDSDGKAVRAINISGNSDNLATAIKSSGNKIILCGNYYSSSLSFGSSNVNNAGEWDSFVAVYDNDLQILDAKNIGGELEDMITTTSLDEAGNIAIAGHFKSDTLHIENMKFVNFSAEDDLPQMDIFVAVYDAQGNLSWADTYGNLPNDFATSVLLKESGNILLGGYTISPVLEIGNHDITQSQPGSGYSDLFVVEINPQGNGVWSEVLHSELDDEDMLLCLNENNLLVAGNFRGATLNAGELSAVNSGETGSYEAFVARYDRSTSIEKHLMVAPIVYPNPVVHKLYLKDTAPSAKNIQIYDAYGRLCLEKSIDDNVIAVDFLAPGLYFLKIAGNGESCAIPFIRSSN